MIDHPLYILAILCALSAASEWLAHHTWLRHLGGALLVIVLAAIAANVGIVPAYGSDVRIYGVIFGSVAQLGIFWLLLQVDLRRVLRSGLPLLSMFLIGALGTMVGVLLGMLIVDGPAAFGERYFALGGMFVGTYVGGSVNFNAIALEYGVTQDGALYAGSAAVDNAMTTVWMAVCVGVPRLLGAGRRGEAVAARNATAVTPGDRENLGMVDLCGTLAVGCAALWGSETISTWLGGRGIAVPSILVLTTLALVLAHLPGIPKRGAPVLGLAAVYVFLAVIGTLCDLEAVRGIGALAGSLSLFVVIVVVVHGIITFGVARLFRIDPAVAAVASQANIGGATSALALARSLDRHDLVLPGVLVGSLGLALGNYLGFLTAALLS